MTKSFIFTTRPNLQRVTHRQVLKYDQRGDAWSTPVFSRPNWRQLSFKRKVEILGSAHLILAEISDAGETYENFSQSSIALVDGVVFLDGLMPHPAEKTQYPKSFVDVANEVLNPKLPFKNLGQFLALLNCAEDPPMKKSVKQGLMIASLATGLLLTAAGVYNYSRIQDGYTILVHNGPRAALNYFTDSDSAETTDKLFGQAWSLFSLRHLDESEAIGQVLLKSKSSKELARAHYLLGNIFSAKGEHVQALMHFSQAEDHYNKTGKAEGVYLVQLSLAKTHLSLNQLDDAEYYLNQADQLGESQRAYSLALRSDLLLRRGRLNPAIETIWQAIALTPQNSHKYGELLGDAGLYYALAGDPDTATALTLRSQAITMSADNGLMAKYNMVNWMAINKCKGIDHLTIQNSLKEWARESNEARIQQLVGIVEKSDCGLGSDRSSPLDPPPPPPPSMANSTQPEGSQGN